MKYLLCILMLFVLGCGQRTDRGYKAPDEADHRADTGRMVIISKQTYRSRNITVLRDIETGQEFLWVDYGDCMAITPIKEKEKR